MTAISPNPKLSKSTALAKAQTTDARLSALVPTLTTQFSPITVYQPSATVGGQLTAPTFALPSLKGFKGVWVAPDLNGDGSDYYVQVECFGGGGGGGGGSSAAGGGGGGGGEYACEPQYLIVPGQSYTWSVGTPGSGGFTNNSNLPGTSGSSGGTTVFDLAGLSLPGGVIANGGTGGDQTAVGQGGAGGTGSTNSIHFNGGNGGTNNSANGCDNPLSLALTSSMFSQNTLSKSIIKCWYILNDSPDTTAKVNDYSLNSQAGAITNFTGGLQIANTATPTQVPAYASAANPPSEPNPGGVAVAPYFKLGALSSPSARILAPSSLISGAHSTISGWIQCDPSGTWGNTTAGAYAIIAANGQQYLVSGTGTLTGHALFLYNAGTAGNPNWRVYYMTGNGTHTVSINTGLTPTPGTWYYLVATYSSGIMTLYINSVATVTTSTAAFYTSVPAGTKVMGLGTDPGGNANWFFGSMSNFWFATDNILQAGINQAFGSTAPTGGAGGGASGGPSAAGGNGVAAAAGVGGAGGTPATQPTSLAGTTKAAQGGYAGANTHTSDASPAAPAGGPYGGGGGASGNMTIPPVLTTLTIPFTSAATYCGTDAGSGNAGQIYNVNQQSHPAGNLNTVLYTGGQASEAASGSKNSILLLPKNIASQLGNGIWKITQVFLTFTNAFPNNTVASLLEIGYSADTSLPQTYTGASLTDYIGVAEIPVGAETITVDLTPSTFGTYLQNGTATALVIGPGQTPTVDAYSAPSGPEFYCAIYGPGAADTFGNVEYPYLTIMLEKTLTVQQGSAGSGGGILITAVNEEATPIATIEPFATTDSTGNQFAQGFTGSITAFEPSSIASPPLVPAAWHNLTLDAGWSSVVNRAAPRYRVLADGNLQLDGVVSATAGSGTKTLNNSNPLPTGYQPAYAHDYYSSDAVGNRMHISINQAGVISATFPAGATGTWNAEITGIVPLN